MYLIQPLICEKFKNFLFHILENHEKDYKVNEKVYCEGGGAKVCVMSLLEIHKKTLLLFYPSVMLDINSKYKVHGDLFWIRLLREVDRL